MTKRALVQSVSGGVPAGVPWESARERLLGRCPLAWWAAITPRRTEFGKVRLDVRWERLASARRGQAEVSLAGRRTVEMPEGVSYEGVFGRSPTPAAGRSV